MTKTKVEVHKNKCPPRLAGGLTSKYRALSTAQPTVLSRLAPRSGAHTPHRVTGDSVTLSTRTMAFALHSTAALAPARRVAPRRGRTVAPRASARPEADVAETPIALARAMRKARDAAVALAASAAVLSCAGPAAARLEGVNNPQMLPPGPPVEVLDVAGYLTKGEVSRSRARFELEKDTGIKLRVLAQAYPTPRVGGERLLERRRRHRGVRRGSRAGEHPELLRRRERRPGGSAVVLDSAGVQVRTKFYWQENGEEASISNAVSAIDSCFREDSGRNKCAKIQSEFGEEPSSGSSGRRSSDNDECDYFH